jgi:nucleotide-binding universal stress UspA family protein
VTARQSQKRASGADPERPESGEARQSGRWILLATEGRPLSNPVIAHALRLAQERQATVHILAIARVHGVALGLPNPGLLPTKREWAEREQTVERAIRRLRRKGVAADGQIVATRKGAQRICQEAAKEGCEAIVMGADPPRNRVIAEVYWSQEPQRVSRKAQVPVHLLIDGEPEATAVAR